MNEIVQSMCVTVHFPMGCLLAVSIGPEEDSTSIVAEKDGSWRRRRQ